MSDLTVLFHCVINTQLTGLHMKVKVKENCECELYILHF